MVMGFSTMADFFSIAKSTAFQWRKSPFFSGGNHYKMIAEITARPSRRHGYHWLIRLLCIYEHVYSQSSTKKNSTKRGVSRCLVSTTVFLEPSVTEIAK